MAGSSQYTTDHDTIRHWVEARGGEPATVKRTESGGEPGVLRINFPGRGREDSLEAISWEDFFEKFDEAGLAMLYQDQTASGEESRFVKFVSRDTAREKSSGGESSREARSGSSGGNRH